MCYRTNTTSKTIEMFSQNESNISNNNDSKDSIFKKLTKHIKVKN